MAEKEYKSFLDPTPSNDVADSYDQQFTPSTTDSKKYRKFLAGQLTPFSKNISMEENVGDQFDPYGGLKNIDDKLTEADLSDIPEGRAQAQSGWKLAGNAIGQGVTETILGGIEGIGYVLDFEELVNADEQAQEGFDNWFSSGVRQAKEHVQEEAFPIYQSHVALEGTLGQRLTDPTFWAAQGKTIGTTLSLLIPSVGVAKGVGLLGKAVRIGDTALNIGQGVSAALFSRKAESTMEANQIFQQEYGKYLQEGLNDQDARLKAGESAATVFKANLAMLPLDALQYTLALKSFKGLKKGLDSFNGSKAGKVIGGLTQVGSEALEEAYQFTAQEEAIKGVREGITPFGEGFGSRLSDYVEDPEFQTAAFLGGVMGGLFGAVSPISRKVASVNDNYMAKKLAATNLGDIESFNKIDNKIKGNIIVKNLVSDRLDILDEELSEFESSQLENTELSEEDKKDITTKVASFKEDIKYVREADESLKNIDTKYADNPKLRKQYSLLKWEDKVTTSKINELEAKENTLLGDFTDVKDNAVYLHRQIESIGKELKLIKKDKNIPKDLKPKIIESYEKNLSLSKENLTGLLEDIKTTDSNFKVEEYSSPNIEELQKVSKELRGLKEHKERVLRPQMAQIERMSKEAAIEEESNINKRTEENVDKLVKETDKADKAIETQISKESTQEVTTKMEQVTTPEEVDQLKQELEESTTIKESTKKQVQKQLDDKKAQLEEQIAKEKVKITTPVEEGITPITEEKGPSIVGTTVFGEEEVTYTEEGEPVTEAPPEAFGFTPQDKQLSDTAESKEEKDEFQEPTRQTVKTIQKLDSAESTDTRPFAKKTIKTNIAHKNLEQDDKGATKVDKEGNIIVTKTADLASSLQDTYTPNSDIVIFIAKNNTAYEANKDNVNSIPIAIQLKEDYGKKTPTMYLHDMDWITDKNVASEFIDKIKKETQAIRDLMFKDKEPLLSFTTDKSIGWKNQGKESPQRSIRDIIGTDTRPAIGLGTRTGNIHLNKSIPLFNSEFVSGIPYIVLPTANEQYYAVWLKQEEIKNNENRDKYDNTVIALLESYNKRELSGVTNLKELREELNKYYHVNTDRLTTKASADIDKGTKTLFHVNEDRDGVLQVQLLDPNRKDIWFRDYKLIDGKWNTIGKGGELVSKTPAQFKKEFSSKLEDKYPNITKKGIEEGKDFEVFELVEGKLTKVKKDYIDFLSENMVVTAKIQSIPVDGVNTYFSQPNIGINTDVSQMEPVESKKRNIEAKKADIEKRRQDELDINSKKMQDRINLLEKAKKYGTTIEEVNNYYLNKKDKWINEDNEIYKLLEILAQDSKAEKSTIQYEINYFTEELKKWKVSRSTKSRSGKINAKYDAELEALEYKQESKPSNPEPQNTKEITVTAQDVEIKTTSKGDVVKDVKEPVKKEKKDLNSLLKYEDSKYKLSNLNNKLYYSTFNNTLITAKNIDEELKKVEEELEKQTAGGTHAFFEHVEGIQQGYDKETIASIRFTYKDGVFELEYDSDKYMREGSVTVTLSGKPMLLNKDYIRNLNKAIKALYNEIGDYDLYIIDSGTKKKASEFLKIKTKELSKEIPLAKPKRSDKFKKGTIKTIKKLEDGSDTQDLIDNNIDFNRLSINSFTLLPDLQQEEAIVNSLTSAVLRTLDELKAQGKKADISKAQEIVLQDLQDEYTFYEYYSKNVPTKEDIDLGAEESMEDNATIAKNIKLIVDNFNKTEEGDKIKFVGFGFRISDAIINLKYTVLDEVESEQDELDKNVYTDSWMFKLDPEKSLSAQVKRMLSFIPKTNKEGNIESNFLGFEVYESYREVFNMLGNALSNIPLQEMYSTLESLAKNNTMAAGVLEELDKLKVSDKAAYNKFFVVFRRQEALFKMLRAYPKDSEGNLSYNVFESNRSGASSVIVDSWHENFKSKGIDSKLLLIDKNTGQLNIDINKGKEYNKRFKDIRKSDDNFDTKLKTLSEVLNEIGINSSIEELKKLNEDRRDSYTSKKKYKYDNYYAPHKDFSTFMQEELGYIFNTIAGSKATQETTEQPWQDNNPFYSQTKRITGLASYHAQFNPNITSASFRNANGDLIQSFVMPQHTSNRMQKIKKDKQYVQALKTIPFISTSTWLDQEVELSYFDASRNIKSFQDAKNFADQSLTEKELTKIGLFQKRGKKAIFLGNTPSDKTTFSLYETLRHTVSLGTGVFNNGIINEELINLNSETINTVYNLLIQSEVNRINTVMKQFNSKSISDLIPGYHYIKDAQTGQTIPGGGNYFFFVPELNETVKKYRNSEGLLDLGEKGIQEFKQVLANKIVKLSNDKVQSWNEKGIVDFNKGTHTFDKSYASKLNPDVSPEGKPQNLINQAASDMVINYMMSYANQFQLITGDPALFTKPSYKFKDARSLIANVSDNIFKRTAKDIAPGIEGVFDTLTFNTLFINEPTDSSIMSTYGERLGELSKVYNKMDLADAQEWTTVREHLNVLHAYGKISEPRLRNLLNKIDLRNKASQENKEKYNLTWEEIATVLQPVKPVYVTSTIDEDLNTDVHYYIKTSSFPLIPQLTDGLEIDKLREVMELNNVDRAVVNSGVKTGFRNGVDVFKNGNVEIGYSLKSGIQTLERSGFRIQQEIPHDYTKNAILEGSQLRKLKFSNLITNLDFTLGSKKDYKGYDLKKLDDSIHNKIYELKYKNLLNKLGVKEGTNTIEDVTKLRDLLISTARDLGYSYNDVMLLNTISLDSGKVAFDIPLFYHNEGNKIESMLNSIIKNKVLKNKMAGLSFVQGSSSGFVSKFKGESFVKEMLKTTNSRIAYTKHYNGEKLDYREYEENGKKIIYGEVFAPFTFLGKNPDGKKQPLDIKDYVDANGFIIESKIDDSLLNMLGYRIPTQGHNSMIKLKVVGFLPQEAGDLIIVPGAITKQMGADFDVDKLYTHFYNYNVDKDGNITKVGYNIDEGVDNMSEEELQNLSMDITYSILANETVQNEYQFQPIDSPALEIDKAKIKSMKSGKKLDVNRTKPQDSSIAYDEYQTHMVEVNAAGKIGIGSFSSASANHILFQYAGIHLSVPTDKEGNLKKDEFVSVMFTGKDGNIYTDKRSGEDYDINRVNNKEEIKYAYSPEYGAWRLDKVWTFPNPITGEKKSISEVISYYQSASVDNAKDQHLFDLHQNKETFRATALIARAGFDEMIINRFINQPIIIEYVKRLTNASNFTENEFEPQKIQGIQNQLFSELGVSNPKSLKLIAPSIEEMEESIKNDGKNKNFQARILNNFIKYNEVAKEIARVQNSINTDTGYLGKSIYSSIVKKDNLAKPTKYLANKKNLVTDTTQGGAIKYGLEASIDLFSGNNLFPINSQVVSKLFEDISTELDTEISEDLAYSIMSDMRASLFTNALKTTVHEDIDINGERERLLYGTKTELSLAKQIHAFKQKSSNPFIQALSTNIAYVEGDPDVLEFAASKEIKQDLNFNMLIGWNNLLKSPENSEERKLGEALVRYSLLIGNQRNARDFGRFLSYDYIVSSGLNKYYRDIDLSSSNDISDKLITNFYTQWFQHNPFRAKQVSPIHMANATDFKGKKTKEGEIPDVFKLKNLEAKGMDKILLNSIGEPIIPDFLLYLTKDFKLNLYKYENGNYVRIPTLGKKNKLIKEFNIDEVNQQSIFTEPIKEVIVKNVEIHKTPIVQTEGNKIFDKYNFDKGFDAVLDEIINSSDNEYNVAIAKYYKKNLDVIKDYTLEVFDPNRHFSTKLNAPVNPRGRTKHSDKWIAINPIMNDTINKFEEVVLHEMTHAILASKLDKKDNPELTKILNSFDKHKDKLSDAEWLEQIGVEGIEEGSWKYKDYTFTNQSEFAAFLMSNEDFQKILNNLQYEGEKTFMQKIKDIIFKILGINVKTDSKLAEGLGAVIDIIEDNNDSSKEPTSQTKVTQEEGFTSFDLVDGHKLPEIKPQNKFVKSAIVREVGSDFVYIPEIQDDQNRRWVTNHFFRYSGKDYKPYYPYSTGVPKLNTSLVHKINGYFNERVVRIDTKTSTIMFTKDSNDAMPILEIEEIIATEQARRAKESETTDTWYDVEDLIDPENVNNVERLIINKEKVIKFLKSKLTEKNVNKAKIKAKISILEQQVEFLEEEQKDSRVKQVIEETIKSVENELTTTDAILHSNPDIDILFSTITRLGEIDLYIEGIKDVDKLLGSTVPSIQDEYAVLAGNAKRVSKIYKEQRNKAIATIGEKISYKGTTEKNLFADIEDINFATRSATGLRESNSKLVKFADDVIHKVEHNITEAQVKISSEINNNIKTIEKHTGLSGEKLYDTFLQFYENGDWTGNFISKYKQEFFDTRNDKYIAANDGKIAWKEYFKWVQNNSYTVTEEELRTGKSDIFSKEAMEAQVEKLKDYEATKKEFLSQLEGDPLAVEKENNWLEENSPYIYLKQVHGGIYKPGRKGYKYIIESKPKETWSDKRFDKIKNDKVLLNFYNFMLDTFEENNKTLPFTGRIPSNYLPELNKTFSETTKNESIWKGLARLGPEFMNAVTDEVQGVIDYDIEIGNRKWKSIPTQMMYNKFTVKDKSKDLSKILKNHSAMANAYKYKAKVEPLLNAMQQALEDVNEITIVETVKGKKPLKDIWNSTKKKEGKLINTKIQLEYALNAFLYGEFGKVEGRIGKVILNEKDKAKITELDTKLEAKEISKEQYDNKVGSIGRQVTATGISNVIGKYTYLNALGFPNIITPSVNLTFGIASNFIYASGNEDTNLKDMRKAMGMFTTALTTSAVDNKQIKKIWAFMDKMGVLDDFNESLYGKKKTIADMLLFLQTNTERVNRGTLMLSILLNKKLKDTNGKEVNIYNAFKMEEGQLVWDTAKMGTQEEVAEQDIMTDKGINIFRLKRLIEGTNQQVHGDYESYLEGKSTIVGKNLMMFKTWMGMSFLNRFRAQTYDDQLQRDIKGRYTVLFTAKDAQGEKIRKRDFLKLLASAGFKKNGLAGLSEIDRAAVRRNLKELQFITQFMLAVLALSSIETDDEEEKFALNLIINFLTKSQADLSFFADPAAMSQVVNNIAPVYTTVRNIYSIGDVAMKMISGHPVYEAGPNRDKNRGLIWAGKVTPGVSGGLRMINYGDRVINYF